MAGKPSKKTERGKPPEDIQAELTKLKAALKKARQTVKRAVETERQSVAELQIINSIQQGLAAELDFQAIVDLVGDKLREVFNTPDFEIRWYDENTNLLHFLYNYEHGSRLNISPVNPPAGGVFDTLQKTRKPYVFNSVIEMEKLNAFIIPGTDNDVRKSVVWIPIISSGRVCGLIGTQNFERENAYGESELRLLTTIAASLGTALENAHLFDEVQKKNTEIAQALEYQTAIGEILQAIAQSPTDIQPVLNVIVENARRLCNASMSEVYRADGTMVYSVATSDISDDVLETAREVSSQSYPAPLNWDSTLSSRAILSREIVHIPDMEHADDLPEITRRYVEAKILNSVLHVPLMREGEAIGCIGIGKRNPAPFTEKQIALMQTFASQAVIAIENVRLFNELQQRNAEITEALEYQTATSEILRVIASSPTDIQPVLDAISENALKLCGANFSAVYNYDGKLLDMTALRNFTPQATEEIQREYPRPLTRDGGYSARSILDKKVIHVIDALNDPDIPEATRPLVAKLGFRSGLWVPMIREDNAIGAFCVARPEPGPFSEKKIQLLQTFANQATIAIENVRLFNETQNLLKETEERNAELAVINSVQAALAAKLEMQAIYDAVGDKIREIFKAETTFIAFYDIENNKVIAPYYTDKDAQNLIFSRPYGKGLFEVVIESGKPLLLHTSKEQNEAGSFTIASPDSSEDLNESFLGVPIFRNGKAIGVVSVQKYKQYAFDQNDLRLLTTLANSMSVALENARLFDETQRLLDETAQRAAELAIINSVQEGLASKLDVQAIYDLVGDKIRDIFHATGTAIYLFNPESGCQDTPYCFLKQRFVIETHPYSEMCNLMITDPQPRIYRNVGEYRALGGQVLENSEEFKSGMNAPLMVGKEIKGMIHIANLDKENAYNDSDLRLLQTLANSMSVALENARLFDETQRLFKEAQESRAAAEHANQAKSAFLANMSHELRTPLNAIMGFTRIVRRKGESVLPQQQIENLDKVLDSSEHLLHLINTVLDIAKIEAGRMDVQAANFNVNALMDLCANTAAPLVKPSVRLVKQADEIGVVYSDQDKVKQILLNLLSNAAKFTADGEIALQARKENETLIVNVCDTGIGISEEALGKVFEEFQQADTGTTRQYGGTGLGLTISRSLARLLGGDLTAQSEYGKGSTFTLTVPIRYEPKPAPRQDNASPPDLEADPVHRAESTPEAGQA